MALGLKKQKARKPVIKSVATTQSDTPAPHKFTARQAAFIDNYMISRNASDAARKAGYAPKDANVQGPRLLSNVGIKTEVDRRIGEQRQASKLNAQWVIDRLMRFADANLSDCMVSEGNGPPVLRLNNLTREQAYALNSVTVEEFKDGRSDKREVRRVKFSLADRVKSLELLGRRLKLFGDTLDVNHKHSLTLMGLMMQEIDQESRGPKVIEHKE